MNKKVLCGLLVAGSFLYAIEPSNNTETERAVLPQEINLRIGLGTSSGVQEEHPDNAGSTLGKILGTSVFATATGAALTGSLPLIKNSEALLNPISFLLISSLLLVSQWHVIKKMFGSSYVDFATWVSTASMVAFGCGILAIEKGKVDRASAKKDAAA